MSQIDKKDKLDNDKISEEETHMLGILKTEKQKMTILKLQNKKELHFKKLKVIILVSVILGLLGLIWGVTKFDLLNVKNSQVWKKLPFFAKEEKVKRKRTKQPKSSPC